MDRRVTSSSWGPLPLYKQALKLDRVERYFILYDISEIDCQRSLGLNTV